MKQLKETILGVISDGNENAINDVFTLYSNKDKGIVIEIEDFNGNTIGSIKLHGLLFNHKYEEKGELSIADFDRDYLYDTESELVRIQLDGIIDDK